ncbi:MAG: hypothetical protein ACOYXU_00110 [Nitrospirota bacterium]
MTTVNPGQRLMSRSVRRGRVFAGGVAVVCSLLLAACSGNSGGGGDGPVPTVFITPSTANVPKGQSKSFTATVVDAGPGVTWTVEGGVQYGTITATGPTTALYTAPSGLPAGPITIRATSTDDPRGAATASVLVVIGSDVDQLTVGANVGLSPTGAIGNTYSGGQRSVSVSGSRVFTVWNDNHTGDQDVYLAVSTDRGATFGNPIRVNDDATTEAQLAPSVAVDATGRVVIAWIDARLNLDMVDPMYDVYVATATIDQGGIATVGTNQRVTTLGTHESRDPSVSLAIDAAGNVYVAWGDGTVTDTDVMLTKGVRLSSGLLNFASPVRVHENFASDQSRPSVAVDAAGNVVVAWMDEQGGTGWDIYWRRGLFTAAGAVTWTTANEIRVNIDTDGDQVSPSVGIDRQTGVAYVAWGQQIGLERRKLYIAKSDSAAMAVSANVDVLPAVDADQNFPSLVISGDDVTIGFADNRECPAPCSLDPLDQNGTGSTDVYFVRSTGRDQVSNLLMLNFGGNLRVNTDQVGTASHGRASVAVDDIGRAYVVWADSREQASPLARAFFARVE